VLALRDEILDGLHLFVGGSIDDPALVLVVATEARAVDLGDDGASFGRRASNSSATRGRPPVMSLVLALSSGIRASTSPALTLAPAFDRQDRVTGSSRQRVPATAQLGISPSLPLITMPAQIGCRAASRQSMTRRLVMPVASSTFLGHRHAVDQVFEFTVPSPFGEDRAGVGVPLGHALAALDGVALLDQTASRRSRLHGTLHCPRRR
jgi:hypothetical protein